MASSSSTLPPVAASVVASVPSSSIPVPSRRDNNASVSVPSLPCTSTFYEYTSKPFNDLIYEIATVMPLVMHGSGDVVTVDVDPSSVMLLSELTAIYIADLVDAAVDAHNIYTDTDNHGVTTSTSHKNTQKNKMRKSNGSTETAMTILTPPPGYDRRRKPPLPSLPEVHNHNKTTTNAAANTTKNNSSHDNALFQKGKRKIRITDEFWDQPLKKPKINTPASSNKKETKVLLSSPKKQPQHEENDESTKKQPHVDEWVGVAGIDLFEISRSRSAHVRSAYTIGVQSFIFPICHDAILYGRVMHIQSERRKFLPLLTDPIIMEMVQSEGRKHDYIKGIKNPRILKSKKKIGTGGGSSGGGANNNNNNSNNNTKDGGGGGNYHDNKEKTTVSFVEDEELVGGVAQGEGTNESGHELLAEIEKPAWPGLDDHLLPIFSEKWKW